MRASFLRRLTAMAPAALLLAMLAWPAGAAAQQAAVPSVVVRATRDPVDKSYRRMVRGMDRFEREHALAPQAVLRFQLLPRLPSVNMHDITLKIVGDTFALPVALAPDNSFTVPRDAQALREDAQLIANRKTTSMTWRADVRSPGVPEGMRRLGDLRLECRVGMEAGLVSNSQQAFAWLGRLLESPEQVCEHPDGNYLFFTDRPLFAVHLLNGTRTATLAFRMLYAGGVQTAATLPYCDCQSLLDRSYYAPLWDSSWPDDALLSFEYMDDAAADAPPDPDFTIGRSTSAQARAALGAPDTQVRFDSGYQAWLYLRPNTRAEDRNAAAAEWLVMLFDGSGTLRRLRRHAPP